MHNIYDATNAALYGFESIALLWTREQSSRLILSLARFVECFTTKAGRICYESKTFRVYRGGPFFITSPVIYVRIDTRGYRPTVRPLLASKTVTTIEARTERF